MLINIKILPKRKKIDVSLGNWYFLDVGSNSHNDICDIIPAMIANKIPRNVLVTKGAKKKKAIMAPSGSNKAEIKVYLIAVSLLPVE